MSLFPLNQRIIQQYAADLNQVLAQEIRTAMEQSQKEFQSDYLDFGRPSGWPTLTNMKLWTGRRNT